MYCKFYGLKEKPFNVTADPAFFFLSSQHKEALAHLHYGVSQRTGIIVITGEIGTGKTTLCKFFLNQLSEEVKTAFILNPYFSEIELLEAILGDFGIRAWNKTRLAMVSKLNSFLLKESKAGKNILLLIDESQNLGPAQLEQIRLLSNLETEKNKLLQIILVGQPELKQTLKLYRLRQLQQRIMIRYHIAPLNKEEVAEYIAHRLSVAGNKSKISFEHGALEIIADFSSGMPRMINAICDRALLAAFLKEERLIKEEIVLRCLSELKDYFAIGAG